MYFVLQKLEKIWILNLNSSLEQTEKRVKRTINVKPRSESTVIIGRLKRGILSLLYNKKNV